MDWESSDWNGSQGASSSAAADALSRANWLTVVLRSERATGCTGREDTWHDGRAGTTTYTLSECSMPQKKAKTGHE